MHILHFWIAGSADSFFRAVWSLFHYGPGAGDGGRVCGKRSSAPGCGGYIFPFLFGGKAVQPPLEYGGQRPPTAQWTATASGAIILGREGLGPVRVREVSFGRITDLGISDANNMGAAMAPAAASTILGYFRDTNTTPEDFDLILTGDLGRVGSDLLYTLLEKENVTIRQKHNDGGLMLYDREKQDVHAGASGCGCSASVLCSIILKEMEEKKLRKVLFAATGALMSPTSTQQGESIPGISHLIFLESGNP